tara:strand:+ start:123 stop:392 length:270 start_codon:yes stop_codon:yes gene_type:complete
MANKYFEKFSFLFDSEPEMKAIKQEKPFRSYKQKIEGLPTYALKKRIAKFKEQVALLDETTIDEATRTEIDAVMSPIYEELERRGESFE